RRPGRAAGECPVDPEPGRRHRPPGRGLTLSPNRQLCQAVALLGIAVALVLVFIPIEANFADDPLLRLQGFGRQAGPAPTTTDCGSPLSNLGTPSGGGTLYQVASDRACHEASKRRAAIAFAAGTLLVVLGMTGVVGGQRQGAGLRGPADLAPRHRGG